MIHSYDSLDKVLHRAIVLELATKNKTLPLLYLDNARGEATRFFLKRGVSARRLCPVNRDEAACASLFTATGVVARHQDIDDVVSETRRRYSVVWLDYECRTISSDTLRASLMIAPHVVLALSLRAKSLEASCAALQRTVAASGGWMSSDPCRYSGKSGVRNMLFAVVHCNESTPKVDDVSPLVGKVVLLPETEWDQEARLQYCDVKRRNGKLAFRLVGTHRKSSLRVRAIEKNNRTFPYDEQWVLSAANARAFLAS